MNYHTPVEMGPLPVRLRVKDVVLLDAGGAFRNYGRIELIEGELLYMNAQFRPHMFAKDELAYRIRQALEANGIDLFVGTEASVHLSDHDLPQPDIILTSAARGDGPVPGDSVRLLVEVADTTLDHDLGRKAAMYASARVAEYWVVDLNGRVIHQLANPEGVQFSQHHEVPFGQPIVAITIPGLIVATDRL